MTDIKTKHSMTKGKLHKPQSQSGNHKLPKSHQTNHGGAFDQKALTIPKSVAAKPSAEAFLATLMATPDPSDESMETLVAIGRGMFANAKCRLRIGCYLKLIVSNTTHLPQFRVSSNPGQGILTSKGDTAVATLWAYVQLIWNAFFTHSTTVHMITNPTIFTSNASDVYVGILYQGLAADTQSTTLTTAFAAGASARNFRLFRGGAGGLTISDPAFHLTARNPFPFSANSTGWQLTPTTSEIFQISFTTPLATTTDGDNYGYALSTWDVSVKYQAPSS